MNLSQLMRDIEKLKGIWLRPLGRARPVRVVEVDRKHERVVLDVENSDNKASRAFSEFERLLEALNTSPAIHVDSVLAGSGTSRNQPETVLANLPSVEVLYVSGRKHLAKVSEPSHKYGTVREMDPIQAQEVLREIAASRTRALISVLVVTDDLVGVCKALSVATGAPTTMMEHNVATVGDGLERIWVADPSIGLPVRNYPLFDQGAVKDAKTSIELGRVSYAVVELVGLDVLMRRS